jgi:hypothetical protein
MTYRASGVTEYPACEFTVNADAGGPSSLEQQLATLEITVINCGRLAQPAGGELTRRVHNWRRLRHNLLLSNRRRLDADHCDNDKQE